MNLHQKVLLIFVQVFFFPNKDKLFSEKKNGTNNAVTLLVENVTERFKNKQSVLEVFLNLSNSFDTIDHSILIKKLQHYRIRGLVFRSYLNRRYQRIQIRCQKVDGWMLHLYPPFTGKRRRRYT